MVAVREIGETFRCGICGNEVEVTKAGGGELVCCGQPMQPMAETAPAPEAPDTEGAEEAPEEFEKTPEEEPSEEPDEEERPQTF